MSTKNNTTTYTYTGQKAPDDVRNVVFAANVTSIGDLAFSDCQLLTTITIPSHITSIGKIAFHCCRSLRSIVLPPSITSIGDYAFDSCRHLTAITIPPNVTSIGACAFVGCHSLTTVTIPPNVTSMYVNAFELCDSLTNINLSPNTAFITILSNNVPYVINNRLGTLIDVINNQLRPNVNDVLYSSPVSQKLIDIVRSDYRKYNKGTGNKIHALYVNWDQWGKRNERSPLFAACEANIRPSEGLLRILHTYNPAIHNVDAQTGLEAFMLAAVGSESKLESVYVLLENHPAVISPYVNRISSTSRADCSSRKRKALDS